MLVAKAVVVALLAFVAVAYAAESEAVVASETAEVATDMVVAAGDTKGSRKKDKPKPKAGAMMKAADTPKPKKAFIRPHMHPRGGLFSGHTDPFPVGYSAGKWRKNVRYYDGGNARTTEDLLRPYKGVDRRTEVRVPSEERGPYPWETPEYEAEYGRRTGKAARRPARKQRVTLPVVHYPRGSHGVRPRSARSGKDLAHPSKPRRATTPQAPRSPKGSRAGRRSGRKASRRSGRRAAGRRVPKKALRKHGKKIASLADRVSRLEKTVTFALRELGKHLGKIRKLDKFAGKGKKAIELIARTLQSDEKRITLTANQVDELRRNAIKDQANVKNLDTRSKAVHALLKKHKAAIRALATDIIGAKATQKALAITANAHSKQMAKDRAQVAANQANVKALHSAAQKFQAGIVHLHNRELATRTLAAKQKKELKAAMKVVAADRAVVAANQANVKALHTAAQKFQAGIVHLHNRELATRTLATKQKKALKAAMKIVAAEKKKIAALKAGQAKLKKGQASLKKKVAKKTGKKF